MLWVDKYRPKTLDKVIVHEDTALNLKKLVSEQDCPHLLFYGPPGCGKKTLIMALLREMFGASADKVKVENKGWKVDAGTRTIEIELTTLSSTHHIELNPSDAGFQDRYIVQEIIKEMARNRPIDTKGKRGFKVLVLNEVDKLSKEAQHSLRRTMEKYSASCRLILCCNSSSKVTEAVRSRCLNIRVNAPNDEEVVKVLEFIGKKEGLQLPSGFAARVAAKSNRSLRRAILLLETCRVQQYPFTANQAIPPMDWEEYVCEIASDIMKEQSPKRGCHPSTSFLNPLPPPPLTAENPDFQPPLPPPPGESINSLFWRVHQQPSVASPSTKTIVSGWFGLVRGGSTLCGEERDGDWKIIGPWLMVEPWRWCRKAVILSLVVGVLREYFNRGEVTVGLFQVRGKFYELLVNCIPPEIVLKRLLSELLKKLDAELKHEVCHWAAYYEHRMRLGQKAIFHLEAFVAKFMSIYKGFLIATFG
ncbi:hypothetical protein KSS87_000807 [Heliosperma pusillum]|nr:hypothetical protein KSS87_000807 [Heliosperma pusillum]